MVVKIDMKRFIKTYNAIEGFHKYPNAPEFCAFLANRHRHIFIVECLFSVTHNEREIEIIDTQQRIESYLTDIYGRPCEFRDMSCEQIAEELLLFFGNMVECTVLEDGFGGAILKKEAI